MKKSIWIVLATVLVALVSAGCAKEFDDSEIWGRISDLDQRLTALEQTVKTLNEKTVPGLQTIIEALVAKDPVVSVTKTDEGALITFYSGKTAVVPIDKGDPGESPVMGVKLVDGVYCWTVNGELIKDGDGKPVPVNGKDGANPTFRTNDGALEYSIDGVNWVPVPAVGTPAAVVTVDETDESVIITSGSTTIVLSKELPFSIKFIIPETLSILKGETIYVGYTLEGVKDDDVTEVGILTATAGFEAEVEPYSGQNDAGIISITNNSESANVAHKVYIFAANGKGKTDIKGLSFSSTTLKAILNVQVAPAVAGSDVVLNVNADEDYDISISADAPWIHVTPPTRALYEDKLTVTLDDNTTNAYRSGTISLLSKADGSVLDEVDLLQAPSATEATSIASLEIIPDGTTITLYNISTVAASDKRAIVTDGVSSMYVLANGLYAEGVFDFTGVKKTDDAGLTYLDVKSLEMKMDATPIVLDPKDYYEIYFALDNDLNYVYTTMNGDLSKVGGNYVVTNKDEYVQIILADAPSSLGLAALVGKEVTLKAWVINTTGDNDLAFVDAIATEVTELVFTEEPGWTIDFDGDSQLSISSSLPDIYLYSVFSKEDAEEFSTSEFVSLASYYLQDDIWYSIYLYSIFYGYTFDELFPYLAYSGNDSGSVDLDYGKYYVVVTGVDEFGALTGKYAIKEIERVDPHVAASYEDFIGQWEVGSKVWTISEKQNGSTYSVEGACSNEIPGVEIIAEFQDGKFVLPEQVFDVAVETDYGTISPVYFAGQFLYNGYIYCGYGESDDEPGVILTVGKLSDGSFDITAGYSPGGDEEFTYYGLGGTYTTGSYVGYADYIEYNSMPASFTKYVPLDYLYIEDFENQESVLANWTFFDTDGDGYNWEWSGEVLTAHSGAGIIYSHSYINDIGALTPDNWAFSPQVSFTSNNYVCIYALGQDASYSSEHFAVYIIGEAPTAENIASATMLFEATTDATFKRYSYKVPEAFANKTGYIGIRHFNCTDMYYLNIDDVGIVEGDPTAAAAPAKNALRHHVKTESKFKKVKRGAQVSRDTLEGTLPAKPGFRHGDRRIR
ncbi:MAG: choice-of-anchor J domain-containing protein [Bacteroidales bacterium]|nr:choice-of-anchor J domain-containing protein [Bacteroidales bacterium]